MKRFPKRRSLSVPSVISGASRRTKLKRSLKTLRNKFLIEVRELQAWLNPSFSKKSVWWLANPHFWNTFIKPYVSKPVGLIDSSTEVILNGNVVRRDGQDVWWITGNATATFASNHSWGTAMDLKTFAASIKNYQTNPSPIILHPHTYNSFKQEFMTSYNFNFSVVDPKANGGNFITGSST